MEEIWKDVPNYEGIYQVSNLGKVKSLRKNKLLNHSVICGYYGNVFYKDGKKKLFLVHQLVAMCFLDHIPCGFKLVVNHKNFNKTDNRVENLEIVSHRENTNKKHIHSISNYTGVTWYEPYKKWLSQIQVKSKTIHLGYYQEEKDAAEAYEKSFKIVDSILTMTREELNNYLGIVKKETYSKTPGVSYNKRWNKWTCYTRVNGKKKFHGNFKTEREAINKLNEVK